MTSVADFTSCPQNKENWPTMNYLDHVMLRIMSVIDVFYLLFGLENSQCKKMDNGRNVGWEAVWGLYFTTL